MFKINPVFKDYIWGGDKLKTLYGKDSNLAVTAESWELSTHKDGICRIATGADKEMLLSDYIKREGRKALGSNITSEDDLPILIKLIDAKDNLSVQVHPNDEYAKIYENDLGKTEMWVILEAEENAQLVYGFNQQISQAEFEKAIKEDKLQDVLNYINKNIANNVLKAPELLIFQEEEWIKIAKEILNWSCARIPEGLS